MRPTIGIPLSLDNRGRWRADCEYHYIDARYARAVARAEGQPFYLPVEADVASLAASIDALLLPGGDDFAPPRAYPDDVSFDLVSEPQLAFDRALLEAALDLGRPVLGICYGMQLLALVNGGSLHYDLVTDLAVSGHRLEEQEGRHPIEIEPGSRLAGIADASTTLVNSLHHQAVASPGEGMRATAHAPDGVIEAIEQLAPGFRIGVQWHPEKLDSPLSDALFRAFVDAARATPSGS